MELKTLVFVPTYNESGNVEKLINQLQNLNTKFDILFVDDNSPDGTGDILEACANKYKNIIVIHRSCKQGIGTAHQVGINYAYDNGYTQIITMDGDFTHPPQLIPKLMLMSCICEVVVGGRHARKESLEGWDPLRKLMTSVGHQFTNKLLNLECDATSAFRVYRLDKIDRKIFSLVMSKSYSFFFESMCILHENGKMIYDVPAILPPRAAGSSKLKFKDMVECLKLVLILGYKIKVSDKSLYLEVKNES